MTAKARLARASQNNVWSARMTSRLLMSGASGYVGRYLSSRLSSQGFPVEPMHLFVDGELCRLPNQPTIDRSSIVIHLSEDANAGQHASDQKLVETAEHNVRVLSKVASKVIYFSSVAVYDTSAAERHSESSQRFADTPYARFKRNIESHLNAEKDLIVRASNLYGDVAKPGTILGDLMSSAQLTGKPTLRQPNAEKDFIHLRYVSKFIVRALQLNLSGIFNVASGLHTSGTALIDAARGVSPMQLTHLPSPFDNRKFVEVLGESRLRTVIDDLLDGDISHSE
jgi:nucleoside-diphosphate-sugar epimerase